MSEGDGSGWQAENLRLTAFTAASSDLDDLTGSWKAIVGDEPDTVEVKPKERALQESGSFREASLTFKSVPRRIDWMVHPAEMLPDAWSTIGTFADETPHFVDLMKKWLAVSPEIKRIAFGAVLTDPVESRDDGYRRVSARLPFDVDPASRNFVYQINRRRDSRLGIPDLVINRLSKWACIELRTTRLLIGDATAFSDDPLGQFAVRLEVDINTIPEFAGSFNSNNLTDLLGELVALGSEIAEKGDIP